MHGAGRLMALVVAVAVLGCTPASERDLIGTWQITDGSREREHLPEEYREATGALALAADGTFSALELPVFVPQSPANPWPADEEPALLTGSGTWKLGRSGRQMVELSINVSTKDYPGILPYGYLLSIHPKFGGYVLVDYWGDPDVITGIFYSRAESLSSGPTAARVPSPEGSTMTDFPTGLFSPDDTRDQAWADIVAAYHGAAGEQPSGSFTNSEMYRVFYHPGLEPPVLLRLDEMEGHPTRTVAAFAGITPDEPVEVTREVLTPREWRQARRWFSTSGFWSSLENEVLPVDVITLDGPILIVEACRDGRCRALQRRSCDPGDQLCELAVKLLGDRLPDGT